MDKVYETDEPDLKREEKAQALAEKWDRVVQKADPWGYEDQYPQGDEYVSMIKDFLLDADEPLALEVLGLQEFIIEGGCEDIPACVELLDEVREFLGDSPLVAELFDASLPENMEETAGVQENGRFRYYSTQRPVDIGTYPRPAGNKPTAIKNFDSRILSDNGQCLAWGYIEYDRPLTEEEYRSYELKPAFTSGDYISEREKAEKKESSVMEDLLYHKERTKEEIPHKKSDKEKDKER